MGDSSGVGATRAGGRWFSEVGEIALLLPLKRQGGRPCLLRIFPSPDRRTHPYRGWFRRGLKPCGTKCFP